MLNGSKLIITKYSCICSSGIKRWNLLSSWLSFNNFMAGTLLVIGTANWFQILPSLSITHWIHKTPYWIKNSLCQIEYRVYTILRVRQQCLGCVWTQSFCQKAIIIKFTLVGHWVQGTLLDMPHNCPCRYRLLTGNQQVETRHIEGDSQPDRWGCRWISQILLDSWTAELS